HVHGRLDLRGGVADDHRPTERRCGLPQFAEGSNRVTPVEDDVERSDAGTAAGMRVRSSRRGRAVDRGERPAERGDLMGYPEHDVAAGRLGPPPPWGGFRLSGAVTEEGERVARPGFDAAGDA